MQNCRPKAEIAAKRTSSVRELWPIALRRHDDHLGNVVGSSEVTASLGGGGGDSGQVLVYMGGIL